MRSEGIYALVSSLCEAVILVALTWRLVQQSTELLVHRALLWSPNHKRQSLLGLEESLLHLGRLHAREQVAQLALQLLSIVLFQRDLAPVW